MQGLPTLWCFYVETDRGTVQRDVYANDRGDAFCKVSHLTGQKNWTKIRLFRLVRGNDSIEFG